MARVAELAFAHKHKIYSIVYLHMCWNRTGCESRNIDMNRHTKGTNNIPAFACGSSSGGTRATTQLDQFARFTTHSAIGTVEGQEGSRKGAPLRLALHNIRRGLFHGES